MKLALAALVALSLVLPVRAAEKIQVVASFSILGDMAAEIAGDKADILVLVGPNGDAHAFEPSPADAKKLSDAELVLVNGLALDGWIDRLAKASGYTGPVVIASSGIEPRTMIEEESGSSETVVDPHAWQDLSNGVVYVSNIVEALAKADPSNAADYRARGERYIGRLRALDADIRREIAKVPPARRRVITSHDAFGYFAGASGGSFTQLFATSGSGFAVSGSGLVDFTGGTWRWGRTGGPNVHSGLASENADAVDHMVTYRITGLGSETVWLVFFEDKNVGDEEADFDYNDLVVEIRAVPTPMAAGMGIAGLAGVAGVRRRRLA